MSTTIDIEAPPVAIAGERWPLFNFSVAPGFAVTLGCGPTFSDQTALARAISAAAQDVQDAMAAARRETLDHSPEAAVWGTATQRLGQQRVRIEQLRQDVASLRQRADQAAAAGGEIAPLQRMARSVADDLRDAESVVPALDAALQRARTALAEAVGLAVRRAYASACGELTRREEAARQALERALAVHLAELLVAKRGRPQLNNQQLASYAELPASPGGY